MTLTLAPVTATSAAVYCSEQIPCSEMLACGEAGIGLIPVAPGRVGLPSVSPAVLSLTPAVAA